MRKIRPGEMLRYAQNHIGRTTGSFSKFRAEKAWPPFTVMCRLPWITWLGALVNLVLYSVEGLSYTLSLFEPPLFSGGNLFSAYFRGGDWGLKRLRDLSKVTCLRNRGDWFKPKTICLSVHYSFSRGKESNGEVRKPRVLLFRILSRSSLQSLVIQPHQTRPHCVDITCTLCAFVLIVPSSWNLLSSHSRVPSGKLLS